MASNDDEVLTDEQVAAVIKHYDMLTSQRYDVLRQQRVREITEVLREWMLEDLPDLLYHNEVKGKEKDEFWRYLLGKVPKDEEFATVESTEHWARFRELWYEMLTNHFKPWYETHRAAQHEAKQRRVWAFSLTTPDITAASDLWDASIRLFEQRSVPISQGESFLEYGSSGLPHVHGWYETEHGGRVFTKVFKRVWPLWGEDRRHHTKFRGGYHELVKNPAAYNLYASAEQRLIVRKIKSQPLVYGKTRPSSSSPAAPQEEASASPDAQSC